MKKILSMILIFSTALMLLSGCGQQTSDTVSMYDLRQTMEAADSSLPEMLCASNSDDDPDEKFANVSDMDYKKVESFFISYAKEGGKADEIVVIAVKDKNDVDEAVKALRVIGKTAKNCWNSMSRNRSSESRMASYFPRDSMRY